MITKLEGVTIVDSPLPCSVMGIVGERNLTEEIALAWKGRQLYEAAIMEQIGTLTGSAFSAGTDTSLADRVLLEGAVKGEQAHARSLERELGDMLFTMRAVMLRPGWESE